MITTRWQIWINHDGTEASILPAAHYQAHQTAGLLKDDLHDTPLRLLHEWSEAGSLDPGNKEDKHVKAASAFARAWLYDAGGYFDRLGKAKGVSKEAPSDCAHCAHWLAGGPCCWCEGHKVKGDVAHEKCREAVDA